MKKETNKEVKDLSYWKLNAEEDYLKVPISVLKYISELETKQERSYSEEDLEKAYKDGGRNEYDFINKYHCKARISFDKWFEQFKKK